MIRGGHIVVRLGALLALAATSNCSCEPPSAFANVQVERATLTDFFFAGFGVIGAVRTGSARLHIEEVNGGVLDLDVSMNTTVAGGFLEMGAGGIDAEGEYDLSHVDGPTGADLLGPFQGLALNGAFLIGGGLLNLENDRHAEVTIAGFETFFGMALTAGQAWTSIDIAAENDCTDGVDDDDDGETDCADDDCASDEPCIEIACDDGLDGDGDGAIDCDDDDCRNRDGVFCAPLPGEDAGPEVDGGSDDGGSDVDGGSDADGGSEVVDGGDVDGGT